MWNCQDTDYFGESLLEDVESEDMFIVNKDTCSRLGTVDQRDSNIDLMFVPEQLIDIINYEQITDTWGSDYFPILFNIITQREPYKKKFNRLRTKKTEWKKYTAILVGNENKLTEREYLDLRVEEKYTYIENKVKDAVLIATYGKIRKKKEKLNKKKRKTIKRR